MIRPYLAVIHDSFRAALASRIFYIVIAIIVVILVVLAPFHLVELIETDVNASRHFRNPNRIASRLVESVEAEEADEEAAVIAGVWNRLTPQAQKRLAQLVERDSGNAPDETEDRSGPPPETQAMNTLARELNELMAEPDLFDRAVMEERRLPSEAREMIDRGAGTLSATEVQRLNRILLAVVFRRDIDMPAETQMSIYYGPWDLTGSLLSGVSRGEFASSFSGQLLYIFDKFVMSIGIFIAILVTASIIPEMLEAGSLNLLLSKPVSRWGLLVARFLGGCAFILLCATVFFVGIWLLVGMRFRIWEAALLYSIPIYLVVFAMYFSVSVLAGIWFRNAVVSVVMAILFWAICWGVGLGYDRLDCYFYNLAPVDIAVSGDKIVYTNTFQDNTAWNPVSSSWQRVALDKRGDEEAFDFGVVSFVARVDQIPEFTNGALGVTAARPDGGFIGLDGFGVGNGRGERALIQFDWNDSWSARQIGDVPFDARGILKADSDHVVLINSGGTVLQASIPEGEADTDDEDKPGLVGRMFRSATGASGLTPISSNTEYLNLEGPRSAAMNAQGQIAVWARGQLYLLERQPNADDADESEDASSDYRVERQIELGPTAGGAMSSWVAYGGNSVFVILGNGYFYHVDASSMEVVHESIVETAAATRCLTTNSEGSQVAITFRSGRLWLYDAANEREASSYGFGLQGDLLAAGYDGDDVLWIGDRFRAIHRCDRESTRVEDSYLPEPTWLARGFRYLLRPLYRAFPKPGEFYKVLGALTSSKDTRRNPTIDLAREPQPDNPWLPLWSGLGFMVVTLGLACFTFQRADY